MELIDFFEFPAFNTLKQLMGIDKKQYGNLSFLLDTNPLTELEIEQLTSPNGLDIPLTALTYLSDGSLTYKNTRVILYIKDFNNYSEDSENKPKFHLAKCKTLSDMQNNNKFDRYVVSTNTSGKFILNLRFKQKIIQQEHDLQVCKNCLHHLKFNNYNKLTNEKKQLIVQNFTLQDFFSQYKHSLHQTLPRYNTDNAPINDYSKDWQQISLKQKIAANWQCQKCNINCQNNMQKYLHVHHVNSLKYDNHASNLQVLCIYCHAHEYNHNHIKSLKEYKEFKNLYKYNHKF